MGYYQSLPSFKPNLTQLTHSQNPVHLKQTLQFDCLHWPV